MGARDAPEEEEAPVRSRSKSRSRRRSEALQALAAEAAEEAEEEAPAPRHTRLFVVDRGAAPQLQARTCERGLVTAGAVLFNFVLSACHLLRNVMHAEKQCCPGVLPGGAAAACVCVRLAPACRSLTQPLPLLGVFVCFV
jgi:hypothetical protein